MLAAGITKIILKAMMDYFLKFGLLIIDGHSINKKSSRN
jgi:hypothetical protein